MDSTDASATVLFSSRKNKVIAGTVTLVALALFSLLFYSIAIAPSKQPYRDARAQYENVYNANVNLIKLGGSINASGATDDAFTKSTEALKAALKVLAAENEALARYDVLKSGEGGAAYEAFSKKLGEYMAFNNDMVISMQKVRPVIFACSAKMSLVDNDSSNTRGAEEMRSCALGLSALTDIPNEQYGVYASDAAAQYEAVAQNFEKRLSLETIEFAEGVDPKKALDNERDDIVEQLSMIGAVFAKDLNTAKAKVDITNASMTLDDYLSKKSGLF